MRTIDSVRWTWAAAVFALAGCASATLTPSLQSASGGSAAQTTQDATSRPWIDLGAVQPLVYIGDSTANTVTVLNQAGTKLLDVIGGLNVPVGLFVDAQQRLWVANENAHNVLVFDRNKRKAALTLSDAGQLPVDVTVCPNGTAYVSNVETAAQAPGSISVYAPGSTSPTGQLAFPGQGNNLFLTCDAAGNVFTTLFFNPGRTSAGVVEYPGGAQQGAMSLGISLQFPGGIKLDQAGNLLVDDQLAHDVAEYSEAGKATGKVFAYGASSDWSDIAVSGKRLAAVDVILGQVTEISWPGGQTRKVYHTPVGPHGNTTSGIAFDPGQKGS